MLKQEITFENFDGVTVTETHYFNLTKAELIEMEMLADGGSFVDMINRITEIQDAEKLVKEFKRFILATYGVRSDDGKRFIKNDQVREEFTQTNAFSELYMSFLTDENFAADFILGAMPTDMRGAMDEARKAAAANQSIKDNQSAVTPPPAPSVPTTMTIPPSPHI